MSASPVMCRNDVRYPSYIESIFSLVTQSLWQAENVDWLPLDDQERLLDEEEEKESNPALAKPSSNNMTIMLPDMEDFERMAKTSSTPFTGGLRRTVLQTSGSCWIRYFSASGDTPSLLIGVMDPDSVGSASLDTGTGPYQFQPNVKLNYTFKKKFNSKILKSVEPLMLTRKVKQCRLALLGM